MKSATNKPATIDEYISLYPADIQQKLQTIRDTIRKAAPAAEEAISYGMPTFKLNGNLVHFAAFKEHLGFYPTASGIEAFSKELSIYDGSKGTVRLPLDAKLPLDLIRKIVKFRVEKNIAKSQMKKKREVA